MKEFIIKILICYLLSFAIGVERQASRRMLGLRTTILVSIGAFMFVTMSFNTEPNDITRVAAQVVAGIGFLGAGVIIKDKDGRKIRGLTTAATMWCDAAIGVLCASGLLYEAIIGTTLIVLTNTFLRRVNRLINRRTESNYIHEIYHIKLVSNNNDYLNIKDKLDNFINKTNEADYINYDLNKNKKESTLNTDIRILKNKTRLLDKLMEDIYEEYNLKELNINLVEQNKDEEE